MKMAFGGFAGNQCRENREHAKMMDEMLITLWAKMFSYQKSERNVIFRIFCCGNDAVQCTFRCTFRTFGI